MSSTNCLHSDSLSYRELPGIPGTYFTCPYGMGTLSVSSCAKSWEQSRTPEAIRKGIRYQCRTCPFGAIHAGEKPKGLSIRERRVCARCLRQADRLIRGCICVSCYNREREVLIGRNSKGSTPVRCRKIYSKALMFVVDGKVVMRQFDHVASAVEAMTTAIRQERGEVMFAWCAQARIHLE